MRRFINILKSRVVITLFGVLILSLLIWFFGPGLKFGDNNIAPLDSPVSRLIGIIIILVVWGFSNLGIQLNNRDNKNDNKPVGDATNNLEPMDETASSNQVKEEITQIKQGLFEALSILRKIKFKGAGKNKAIYSLPWYLIIGPPGSGKTTTLTNSSLNFPLTEKFNDEIHLNSGGTLNCDWFLTNEAVLIDTAGRYTTQDSQRNNDSSGWKGVLSILKANRRRRPVNGVIITVSLQELLNQTSEERILSAKNMRARIDELIEKFNIRFPVYMIFTKTDQVSGFSEFFEDLGKEEREQVWGVSLPDCRDPSQSPDFKLMSSELHKLVTRTYERVLGRIYQESDLTRRGLIYGFPMQIENAMAIAEKYVTQAFAQNPYQFQPYLRGVYFSSGHQDGNSLNPLTSRVDLYSGYSRSISQQKGNKGREYFLGDLFRKVIFPESELVGSSKKHESIMVWSQRIALVVIAVLTIGILFSWVASVSRHEKYKTQVESYLNEYSNERRNFDRPSIGVNGVLPALNSLGKASLVFDQNSHPWLSGLGLYNNNIDVAVDDAYQYELKNTFLPKLINYLEASLKQSHNTGDLYNTFTVYLMFNKAEYMNKGVVINWFESYWSKHLNGYGDRHSELDAHLNALLSLDLEPIKLNDHLIRQVRDLLKQTPISNRVYSRIRTNADYSKPINMLNEFGESVRETFAISPTIHRALRIPTLFTIEGYENIDLSQDSPIISKIVNERWVMGDEEFERARFIKDDLEKISEQVKALYFSDYTESWNKLFAALEVTKFENLDHANEVLSRFSDPVYSPLVSILTVAKLNTQLSSSVFVNLADEHDEGKIGMATSQLANRFDGNKVDKQFRNLNNLLRNTSKGLMPIDIVMEEVNKLKIFVNQVSVSPDPNKRSFEIIKDRYQNGADNPITLLRAFANNSPQPVQRWLLSLADESWALLLKSAHTHINTEWAARVYRPYMKGLAGRYPLNRSSNQELEIYDFSEFFKPQGTVDTFYIEYIKPFVSTRQRWTNREVDGHSLGISSNSLNQLRKAHKIKTLFFRNSAEVPSLEFQMRPYALSKIDARFTLEIGEKRIDYSHGPKFWKSLSWSGADEDRRVRIVFEDLNDELHSHTYSGPWAWFRLQDNFKLRKVGYSNIYRVEYVVNQLMGENLISHKMEYEIKAQSASNSFGDNSLTSYRCPKYL